MADGSGASGPDSALALRLDLNVEETKAQVIVVEPTLDEELTKRASEFAAQLVAFDPDDQESRVTMLDAVEGMGRTLQHRAATRSRMLQSPLRDLSRETEDGGPVAKSLADLRSRSRNWTPPRWRSSPACSTGC